MRFSFFFFFFVFSISLKYLQQRERRKEERKEGPLGKDPNPGPTPQGDPDPKSAPQIAKPTGLELPKYGHPCGLGALQGVVLHQESPQGRGSLGALEEGRGGRFAGEAGTKSRGKELQRKIQPLHHQPRMPIPLALGRISWARGPSLWEQGAVYRRNLSICPSAPVLPPGAA